MNDRIRKAWVAALAALVLLGVAMGPVAEAADRGRGGGGGGGAARSGGGGGAHKSQVNNSKQDKRTNNVRSTSVNNVNRDVNVNKNVNVDRNVNVDVDVDRRGDCCGWDNDYHPVATAAAVSATVAVTSAVVGSIVNAPPAGCVPVNYGGVVYQQCGSSWYMPQGAQFVVVNPPY